MKWMGQTVVSKTAKTVSMLGCVVALAACGGGGSSSGNSADSTESSDALHSVSHSVQITGVVARGAALSQATVTPHCAESTALAPVTADANGYYQLTVPAAALPCVLEADAADHSLKLHSVAVRDSSAGSSAPNSHLTTHITTITELMVAQLTAQDPSTFTASANANTLDNVLTPARVAAASAKVLPVIQSVGVNTTPLTDIVSQPLVPKTSTSAGNDYDAVLDALDLSLQHAGGKLTDLVGIVASRSRSLGTNNLSAAY